MPELPFLYRPTPHIDSITGYMEHGLPISCFALFIGAKQL